MKFLVLVADGSEEVEVVTVVDYLRRAGIEVDLVSVKAGRKIKGAHDIFMGADYTIDEIDPDEYFGIYIPGGLEGVYAIRENKKVLDIIREMNEENKTVSALCAGPSVLDYADVLENRKFTCYPGFEDNIKSGKYIDERLVLDENIITSKGPGTAADIAFALVEQIKGEEAADKLKRETLYL